ncbi:MAG: glycosyltransferase family 2 protein [Halioglobus sp.]|nr:glycosyltransferase family 2 protein [Halioglobus sp.]
MNRLRLSIVIITYNRERVLIDTIRSLLPQARACDGFDDIIIVDQTATHEPDTEQSLCRWNENGAIRWIRLPRPNLTGAMNRGLLEASSDLVLFLDDDIIPGETLLSSHLAAHASRRGVAAVVGQVLQPGERPEPLEYQPEGGRLQRYMGFPFRSTIACYVENAMAGNLSVNREKALAAGGFDENFTPPVASRFESEFAKRLVARGESIWFEPAASIQHLACSSGGTRSKGSHLNSGSPRYGVGDYYFAMLHGSNRETLLYCLRRFFREVRTRYHLAHPWYIPVKLWGEARAIAQALSLSRREQKLLPGHDD